MKYKILALSVFGLMTATTAYGAQQTVFLDQQWTKADRERFYFTPQGS